MPRPSYPWFRASKNSWWVTGPDGRKVSLGVKGRENQKQALEAWHRLLAGSPPQQPAGPASEPARPSLTVAELLRLYLADAEGRVKPWTPKCYRHSLDPFPLAPG